MFEQLSCSIVDDGRIHKVDSVLKYYSESNNFVAVPSIKYFFSSRMNTRFILHFTVSLSVFHLVSGRILACTFQLQQQEESPCRKGSYILTFNKNIIYRQASIIISVLQFLWIYHQTKLLCSNMFVKIYWYFPCYHVTSDKPIENMKVRDLVNALFRTLLHSENYHC